MSKQVYYNNQDLLMQNYQAKREEQRIKMEAQSEAARLKREQEEEEARLKKEQKEHQKEEVRKQLLEIPIAIKAIEGLQEKISHLETSNKELLAKLNEIKIPELPAVLPVIPPIPDIQPHEERISILEDQLKPIYDAYVVITNILTCNYSECDCSHMMGENAYLYVNNHEIIS